jgi:hypothetical protein
MQKILQPFTGVNHYRYGLKLSKEVKTKISNTLKGRTLSEAVKANHIKGSKKKIIYCYDYTTKAFLMEFAGIRIMSRAINRTNSYVTYYIDKDKPFFCTINNEKYTMFLKSCKI